MCYTRVIGIYSYIAFIAIHFPSMAVVAEVPGRARSCFVAPEDIFIVGAMGSFWISGTKTAVAVAVRTCHCACMGYPCSAVTQGRAPEGVSQTKCIDRPVRVCICGWFVLPGGLKYRMKTIIIDIKVSSWV